MRPPLVLFAVSSVAVLAACGSDSSGPKIGPPSRVSVTASPTTTGAVKTSIGTFSVKVSDANGNAVPAVTVNFFASGGGGISFAPSTATTDGSGLASTTVTLGTKTGGVELTAYATGVSAPATATVTTTPGPLASLVTTPRTIRLVSLGDTARITYVLQDEFANAVTGATLAFGIADPTLVSVDAQGLVRALRTGGATTIAVSAGGRSDTVGVSVLAAGATPCSGVASASPVAVGAVVTVTGANICLPGAAAGSEYTVIAYNSSPNGATRLAATIATAGSSTPPSSLRLPTGAGPMLTRSPVGVGAAATQTLDAGFHLRILSEARGMNRMFGAARAARRARLSGRTSGGLTPSASFASVPSIPTNPNVGDIVSLNVASATCSNPIMRGLRVAAIGTKSLVLADTLNPANGFTDADYRRFAERFDNLVYPLDVDAFGAPHDLDGNGKVAILFTKYVNEMTPANSDSFVGGFFHPRDLFPKNATIDFQGCATSNEGEMFYMLVPDPAGAVNGNKRTLGFVDTLTVGVLAHEFQHLINASRRMYVNTSAQDFEETWLNEGLSHIAEELLYYQVSGMQPRQRLTDALIRPSPEKYAMWRANASSNFSRFLGYVEDPSAWSPIDDDDALETRGAAWALLRYSVDRAFTSDAGVWSRFSNSVKTGLNTMMDGLLTDPRPYLADFALANYVGDLGVNSDPRFIHKSWNYRDIYAKTYGTRDANNVFTPRGYYPIGLTGLSDAAQTSVSVKGGSASYHRLAVAAGREALLTFASGQGAPNASFVFSVVRTK